MSNRKAFVQEAEDNGEHIVVLLNEDGSRAATQKFTLKEDADAAAAHWCEGQTTLLSE